MAKQLKLLILNASVAERETIKTTLNKLNVFTFIEASDSQDALKILKSHPVDIIITGLEVGKIDGWRFSRMIRSGLLKTPKNTPILLTPPIYCERIAETTARSYGIDAVLPFERQDMLPQMLANVLSTHLEKSSRLNLLLLETDSRKAKDISEQLKLSFAITHTTYTKATLATFLQQKFAIVLIDATESHSDTAAGLISEILQHNPKQAIVTIIDNNDADYAEQLLLSGVTDFIRAPYDHSLLSKVCDHAARREDFMVSYAEFAQKVEQLSQSQSRYKELFSAHQRILLHLNTVVLEFNQEGNIRFINPAWEHLTGYGIKSSLAKSLTDFCLPECKTKLQDTIQRILHGGEQQQQVEIQLKHKNG
ncbi:MAG: PAS domain-containing protein, partial [Pseudomonadota bacterium]|nr:PAS domain-containing protein [Pseudomonadota bacterium]